MKQNGLVRFCDGEAVDDDGERHDTQIYLYLKALAAKLLSFQYFMRTQLQDYLCFWILFQVNQGIYSFIMN